MTGIGDDDDDERDDDEKLAPPFLVLHSFAITDKRLKTYSNSHSLDH